MRETTRLLSYWITERELMRLRKGAGELNRRYGYSDNQAMGTVRYCNVRREDDKVTLWLAKHWRPDHHNAWELTLARMVNYIPTLHGLTEVWYGGLSFMSHYMKEKRARGEKIWTSAYTISTCGQAVDKVDYVLGVVQAVQAGFTPPGAPTLAAWHAQLQKVKGMGSFLAAQVVADMKNTAGHPLQDAEDWHTWSAPGPGSLKGLSEYFEAAVTSAYYDKAITQCWTDVKPTLPPHLQDLHMQDFQNCLCEFSKFMRVRKGGHARNKYSVG